MTLAIMSDKFVYGIVLQISKDDRALIKTFTPGEELELTTFAEVVFREELEQDKRGPAA